MSRSVQRYVQRAVQRPLEKKLKTEVDAPVAYNGTASATGDVIPFLPIVQTGDTSYQRDGRSINAKSVSVRFTLRWDPLSTGAASSESPIYACVWHVIDKQQKSFQAVASNSLGAFPYNYFDVLLNTVNAPAAPIGHWAELGAPLDTRRFIVKRKMVRLNPDSTGLYVGAGAAGSTLRAADGSDALMKTLRFGMRFPKGGKLLTYRDDGQNYPDNLNSYFFITYYTPNTMSGGYSPLTGTQLRVQVTRVMRFTDA